MATLTESQAFLDQFDKCLSLCQCGDVVTVVNALHSLNEITQAGLWQALELDPTSGQDFVCSFLLELELALELYISPLKKLGTIDGGLPKLYSFTDEELMQLPEVPSMATKAKVRKFLDALKVAPSSAFESRSVKDVVWEFSAAQVKTAPKPSDTVAKQCNNQSVSWADLCSSGSECDSESDDELPPLEIEDDEDDEAEASENAHVGEVEEAAVQRKEDFEVEEDVPSDDESVASSIFLWAAPTKHIETNFDDYSPRSAAHNKAQADARRSRLLYPFFKTVMCKNYPNCRYGDKCNFAHGEHELRKLDETILDAVPRPKSPESDTASQTSTTASTASSGSNHFKTRMCKNYEKNGFCKFGDRCNFAHGKDELRRGEGRSGEAKAKASK